MEKTPAEVAADLHARRLEERPPVIIHSEYGAWSRRLRDVLSIGAIILMLLVLQGQSEIQSFQQEGRERTFQSRAVNCRVVRLLGGSFAPDDPCLQPEVVQHYDPEERPTAGAASEGQQVNRRLMCLVITTLGVQSPDCDG